MEILLIKDAAAFLGFSRQGIYDAIARGDLKAETIYGRAGIKLSALERYKQSRQENGTGKRGPELGTKKRKKKATKKK